jgi:hypothetical protein
MFQNFFGAGYSLYGLLLDKLMNFLFYNDHLLVQSLSLFLFFTLLITLIGWAFRKSIWIAALIIVIIPLYLVVKNVVLLFAGLYLCYKMVEMFRGKSIFSN